jgi:hypothetical protein
MQTLTQIKTTIRKIARQTQTQIGETIGCQYNCKRTGMRKGAPVRMGHGLWLNVEPVLDSFKGSEGYDKRAAVLKISALHTALLAAGLEATWEGRYCDSILVRVG